MLMTAQMGPNGQCSTAFQLLGTASDTSGAFAGYHKGTFLQAGSASGVQSSSVMLSLFLFGFGVFLLFVSMCAILEVAWKGQIQFNFGFWSTIFPMGTMNTAMLVYSTEMDSPTWRVLTVGLFIILVVDFLLYLVFTVHHSWTGNLLISKDARKGEREE